MGAIMRSRQWFQKWSGNVKESELLNRLRLQTEIDALMAAPLYPGGDLTKAERKEIRQHIKAKGRWHGGRYLGEC